MTGLEMIKRKALLIGIDNYPGPNKLNGCVADVESLSERLTRDGNGDPLFDVKKLEDIGASDDAMDSINQLFDGDADIALFYFSGHGFANPTGAELVFPEDISSYHKGITLNDICQIANRSKIKNKIIILDCCHSGDAGKRDMNAQESELFPGITILTACRGNESAMEADGHGVFTQLLCKALDGEAADVCGNITPSSVYTYVDSLLGAWEQRPIFKTNVSSFVVLRKVELRVQKAVLRKLPCYFRDADSEYKLDPSYEFTNAHKYEEYYKLRQPLATEEHVKIFQDLQKLQKIGLVEPVGEEYMYWAAIRSKSCKLTSIGRHYWQLAKKGKL